MNQTTKRAANEWDEAERRLSSIATLMNRRRKIRDEKRARLRSLLAEAARLQRAERRRAGV